MNTTSVQAVGPRLLTLTPNKTYATPENAVKAVLKKFGDRTDLTSLDYFIHTHTDGRFFPVFVGTRAVEAMMHFHFNVVA